MSIRKIKYRGRTQSVKQWAIELNISTRTIYERISLGWPSEMVLSSKYFHFCQNLKAAKKAEQRDGYPTEVHLSNACEPINSICCTHESICHWAIPITPWNDISNDPSEAHYYCKFLDLFVWGEDPKC